MHCTKKCDEFEAITPLSSGCSWVGLHGIVCRWLLPCRSEIEKKKKKRMREKLLLCSELVLASNFEMAAVEIESLLVREAVRVQIFAQTFLLSF